MESNQTTDAEGNGAPFSPWRLLPVAVIVAGLAAFWALGGGDYLSFEALKMHREDLLAWRDQHLVLAAAAFTLAYALAASFSLPGAVWLTLAGGFLFGTWQAALYVVVGATAGATAVFLAARYALGDYLRAKAGPAIRKMEDGFRDNALSYMLFLRLVPLFPFWLVNLVPAFLGVPLRTYVLGTFLGIIPGTVVYCLAGNGLGAVFDMGGEPDLSLIFEPQILAPIMGLAVLSLIPIVYKKVTRR